MAMTSNQALFVVLLKLLTVLTRTPWVVGGVGAAVVGATVVGATVVGTPVGANVAPVAVGVWVVEVPVGATVVEVPVGATVDPAVAGAAIWLLRRQLVRTCPVKILAVLPRN